MYSMCGIVGVFSFAEKGLVLADVKVFMQMWKASTLRGEDGAGIFWVADNDTGKGLVEKQDKDGVYSSWLKIQGTPYDLQQTKEFNAMEWELPCSRFVVGHNRAATVGDISTDHAHPFSVGPVTMVHNGTLSSIEGFKEFKKHETDSLALCHALAEKPVEDVLKGINGGAAIIWYNSDTKTLHVYRNSGRPLYYHRQWSRWFVASEGHMLKWLLARNDWTSGQMHRVHDILSFDEDTMYTFTHKDDTPTKTVLRKVNHVIHYPHNNNVAKIKHKPQVPLLPSPENDVPAKVRNHVPAKKYWGVQQGDTVVFEGANLEYLNNNETVGQILGIFHGIGNKVVPNLQQLSDVEIRAKIQRNHKDEIKRLYDSKYLKGKIVSITINAHDLTDVVFYVTDVRATSPEEVQRLVIIKQALPYTPLFPSDSKNDIITPDDGGLVANAVRIAAAGMLH